MALYEWRCGCGEQIERYGRYEDAAPTCCGVEMERMISIPAPPVLTGAGCYETEYGSMAHHLKPLDQRIRAERDCHHAGMIKATPKAGQISERKLEKMQRDAE